MLKNYLFLQAIRLCHFTKLNLPDDLNLFSPNVHLQMCLSQKETA